MNPYEMNKNTLFKAIRTWLMNETGSEFDIYSDKCLEQIQMLEAHIESLPFLDEAFKIQFSNELYMTVNEAALDAFDTGLNIGLSLFTNLLSGEVPDIQIRREQSRKTPRQYRTLFQNNPDFVEYMENADKYMTDEEKKELESKAAYFMQSHLEDASGMF